jgi:hypothetical protein
MRGYPYWPAVVSRDPNNGEFISLTDAFFKPMKKFHVLFLEYGNQRAWVTAASIKEYKGIDKFNSDKERAPKSQRPDYTPGKRYVTPFNKAVSYAETLRGGDDEERLEQVLLRYGWVMVGESAALDKSTARATAAAPSSSSSIKKRKLSGGPPQSIDISLDTEEQVNRSTDSETDGENKELMSGASPLLEAKVRGNKSMEKVAAARLTPGGSARRSSVEAESRIDPGRDDSEVEDGGGSKTPDESSSSVSSSVAAASGSKPAKRQSRSRGGGGAATATVTNGGNESGNSDAEDTELGHPTTAKRKPSSTTASGGGPTKQASSGMKKNVAESPAGSRLDGSATVQPRTAKSGNNKKEAPTLPPPPVAVSPMVAPVPKVPVTPGGTADKEEFPRVGDLVWGRMAGFPYWPSFVTRSPEGKHFFFSTSTNWKYDTLLDRGMGRGGVNVFFFFL